MAKQNDFDAFMKQVAKDSAAAGQTAAFEAYGEHFRLAVRVIRLKQKRAASSARGRSARFGKSRTR